MSLTEFSRRDGKRKDFKMLLNIKGHRDLRKKNKLSAHPMDF